MSIGVASAWTWLPFESVAVSEMSALLAPTIGVPAVGGAVST